MSRFLWQSNPVRPCNGLKNLIVVDPIITPLQIFGHFMVEIAELSLPWHFFTVLLLDKYPNLHKRARVTRFFRIYFPISELSQFKQ
jgi:hypothetical protein